MKDISILAKDIETTQRTQKDGNHVEKADFWNAVAQFESIVQTNNLL